MSNKTVDEKDFREVVFRELFNLENRIEKVEEKLKLIAKQIKREGGNKNEKN